MCDEVEARVQRELEAFRRRVPIASGSVGPAGIVVHTMERQMLAAEIEADIAAVKRPDDPGAEYDGYDSGDGGYGGNDADAVPDGPAPRRRR